MLWNAFVLTSVLTLLTPVSAIAQVVTVSPRVTAMGGYNMSFSAGVRVGIGDPGLGAFAGAGFRAVAEEFDLTSRRESGPGLEVVGGARYQPVTPGRLQPFISAGLGMIYWPDGTSAVTQQRVDPLGEIEAGFAIRITTHTAVVLGGRLDAVHERAANEVEAFVGGVGGVVIGVR
jgi:hypothetical protein